MVKLADTQDLGSCGASLAGSSPASPTKSVTFVGSYTDEDLAGIHILETDLLTGAMRPLNVIRGIENPTYLARNRAGTRLYVVRGFRPGAAPATNGAVAAYAVEGANLRLLNCCPTGDTIPCHISLSPDERTLAYAEYSTAHVGLVAINEAGALDPCSHLKVQHSGRGPDASRQESAHAHYAEVTPDSRFLYVCDLGIDRVVIYNFANWRDEGLHACENLAIHAAPGAGPRHLRFHPNGKLAFLINELDSTVVALQYDGSCFTTVQTISALPKGVQRSDSKAAAVKVSEDGRFLFASNRGHDSIATFAIDQDRGRLDRIAISPLTGSFPRDFEFLPGGRFLLAGHKRSNEIGCYAFDPASGTLTRAAGTYPIHRPTCIVSR